MQEDILQLLKASSDYISGEEISKKLGISRQALWKHIHQLREAGYEIIAVPHLGYRLISIPDRLFPSEIISGLKTKIFGKKIYYFETVSSTMDIAFDLGLKNAPEGTVVLAETQTKGRGRLGRSWSSPKYKGIYLSLILRPKIPPHQVSLLTLVSAVAIVEAIEELTGLSIQIKWPNDIMINQKKLGGILTELNAEMDQIHFVVIGIGINVNNDKKSLISQATSLKEEKKETVNRIELLKEILYRLEENYLLWKDKGPAPIIKKWHLYNITLGIRIKVSLHRGYLEGQALDIDSDGSLLLRDDSGLIHKVTAGDVIHCR